MKRFLRVCKWVAIVLFVLLAVLWFSGLMGSAITRYVVPSFLPFESHDVTVSGISFTGITGTNGPNVTLEISPARAMQLARKSVDFGWLIIPGGLFPDGMVVSGLYSSTNHSSLGKVTFRLVVEDKIDRPKLTVRLPVQFLNDFISKDSGAKLTKKKEYALGSYERTYLPIFKTFRLWSADKHDNRFPITRNLMYEATGKIKIKFEDGLLNLKATGNIKEFNGDVRMDFTRDMDGVILLHQFTVRKLRMSVENLLQWGEEKIADDLKRSMEKNMNKQKGREKIARIRLPVFAPYETEIDVLAE